MLRPRSTPPRTPNDREDGEGQPANTRRRRALRCMTRLPLSLNQKKKIGGEAESSRRWIDFDQEAVKAKDADGDEGDLAEGMSKLAV